MLRALHNQLLLTTGAYGECPQGAVHAVPMHPPDNVALQQQLVQAGVKLAFLPLRGPNWS